MTRLVHRRRGRLPGLTLIELLMVLAILGLVLTMVILYLLPSDDRRVENEARRLAAYLVEAGAEAVMRDGPVRVSFDLAAQTYHREVARLGADLSQIPFEPDPRADKRTVREPVRLTTLVLPAVGEVREGTAWMVWKGRLTDGGVAILELNEAIWSVVVDPNNGQVRVERGRAVIPVRGPGFDRTLLTGGLPALQGTEGFDLSMLASLPTGTEPPDDIPAPPEHEPDPPPDPDASVPPPEPDAGPDPPPDAGEPPEDPPLDAAPPPEPDAAPSSACETDEDCPGALERCVPETGQCVFDPTGHAFRMSNIFVTSSAPQGLLELFGMYVNTAVAVQKFNLIVKFERFTEAVPTDASPMRVWIVQGEGGGTSSRGLDPFRPNRDLPSFGGVAAPTACPSGFTRCYEILAVDPTAQSGEDILGRLDIYVPMLPDQNPSNPACAYQKLTVTAKVIVRLSTAPGSDRVRAGLAIEGIIRRKDARKLFVTRNGERNDLEALFEQDGFAPNYDINGDGGPDGWFIRFEGDAYEVELLGEPYFFINRVPPGCDD